MLRLLFFIKVFPFAFSAYAAIPVPGPAVLKEGLWAVFHNPAGLYNDKYVSAGIFHSYSMLAKEMSTYGAAVLVPAGKAGVCGGGLKQFGYSLYREVGANLSMARGFGGNVAVGVKFEMESVKFGGDYDGYMKYASSAGALVKLPGDITAGVIITNPDKFKNKNIYQNKDDLAMVSLGVGWKFRYATLSAAIVKRMRREEVVAFGFDYRLSERFSISSGVTNALHQFYFGYSLTFGSLELTMHSGYHSILGFSPQAALIYKRK